MLFGAGGGQWKAELWGVGHPTFLPSRHLEPCGHREQTREEL